MVTYRKRGPDLVFRNTTDHPILVMTSNDGRGGVGVYIFNRAGYAPSHQRGTYASTVSAPQVTLNPDGSIDTVITRRITMSGHTTQDYLASHGVPIDP
jgi:vancomycin resistance protein YoaR